MKRHGSSLDQPCPDCGCPVKDHNAVNRLVGTEQCIAHCGHCGGCWKSSPAFVELLRAYLEEQHKKRQG